MSRPEKSKPMGEGRAFKRFARKTGMSDAVYQAHNEGQWAAISGHGFNRYPPGRRHDAWQDGHASMWRRGDKDYV